MVGEDGRSPAAARTARGMQRNRRSHRTPRRERSVRFSLSDEEHAIVAATAEIERLAVGAFAAQATLAAARGSARPEHIVLRETLATVMHAAGQAQRIGVNLNQAVAAMHSGEPPPQLRWYAEAAARAVRRLDDLAEEVRLRLP
ncbi:hypothetical protein [Actinomadura sp. WMMB 499]|uniref:hypothetical protein n=1 Tax=Actinomadura sp. WMMB 499 TaxID=1219491 RepID=UPI0012483E1A|nr:hypothetical protein [Actinomadura sp. WMMB 499]QFG22895.1 hypothetical protein F7P10_19020 [Actinomadura sp. WMMB 499]